MKERRDGWHEQFKEIDPHRLVFLDESGAKTDTARLRGRCDKSRRLVCHSPAGHWTITTMISAIRLTGPFAAATVSGPTDSDVFRTYIREVLAPQLKAGDVVVMDNLQPHHASGIRTAIEAAGGTLLYLPPYSPDFNPIENMWSKVKQHLRSAASRTLDALGQAIDTALASVTPEDCRGFFDHCGYAK